MDPTAAMHQTVPGGKIPDFGPDHTHIFIVFILVSAVIVVLRFYSRVVISKYLGIDDWLMLCAWIMTTVYFIVTIMGFNIGLGRHAWDVPFKNASPIRKYIWILEIMNPIPLGFLKVSILTFYLRVIPVSRLRPYFKFWIVFVILMSIALPLAFFLQCVPLRGSYQIPPNATPVTCINTNALLFSSASLNLFTDIVILAMPIPKFASMKVALPQKIAVLAVFTAGSLVCIASVIRLRTIFAVNTSNDKAWVGKGISLWSAVEMFVAIFTSSLPAIQPLVVHYFPNMWKVNMHKQKSPKLSESSGSENGPSVGNQENWNNDGKDSMPV